jgi:ribonucleoside-diphosphate reductase beta chain
MARTEETQRAFLRDPAKYGSVRGLDYSSVPWRLYQKAKKLFWDPADLDFSQDAKDWQQLGEEQQYMVGGLARGFMVGEEAVTLDILPLVQAIADEGRTEETIFLTTFMLEEAKHVEFFRLWFDAVGFDPRSFNQYVPRDGRRLIFSDELPEVMSRLNGDRSVEALFDAALTYNQFVEGVMAISGYRMWHRVAGQFGIMPGLQEGLEYVQRDERRHIAYGTFLARRLLAEHPELLEFAERRFEELRVIALPLPEEVADQGPPGSAALFEPFRDYAMALIPRRIEALKKALTIQPEEIEAMIDADDAEAQLLDSAEAG